MRSKIIKPLLLPALALLIACGPSSDQQRRYADCSAQPVDLQGDATYYSFADGSGACSFPANLQDPMIGAMNFTDYAGSYACGECVKLAGPDSTITIRIVDKCPECKHGDIDLSPVAFSKIADTVLGRVRISWHIVACPVTGPIVYHFKDGSNQWWTAVQIRNHRYPITSIEYRGPDGQWHPIGRVDYNYFVKADGLGPGPFTFRVTDFFGQSLVDSGVVHMADGDVPGSAQFPVCGDTL